MSGIIINILAVVSGGLIGTLCGHKLSGPFADKLTATFGVCAMGMGVSSIALMQNMPAVILSVVLGTVIGTAAHLEARFAQGAMLLQKPIALFAKQDQRLSQEAYLSLLVTAIILFCMAGTGIYGCLDAGMTGNTTILVSKSILDFFTAIILACSLGPVVSVIAVPQAILYLMMFSVSKMIVPLTTPVMIADFKACGGFLLIATGLRMSKIKEFSVADMVPAMILAMPLSAVWTNCIAPLL